MTAKIHWFGDSWCEGWPGGGTPFANLTSDYLDMPFENYGKHSTNIIDMVEMFLEKKENIFTNDIVIFCLTTSYRFSWINEQNQLIRFGTYQATHKEKVWHVEFVNDNFASFLTHHSLNTLYYMCITLGFKVFFVNSFYYLTRRNMLTPESAWLLPPETCLAKEALGLSLLTPELAIEDRQEFKDVEWANQKINLKKYCIPNDGHPNQNGNIAIANLLTDKLKLKIYDPR